MIIVSHPKYFIHSTPSSEPPSPSPSLPFPSLPSLLLFSLLSLLLPYLSRPLFPSYVLPLLPSPWGPPHSPSSTYHLYTHRPDTPPEHHWIGYFTAKATGAEDKVVCSCFHCTVRSKRAVPSVTVPTCSWPS